MRRNRRRKRRRARRRRGKRRRRNKRRGAGRKWRQEIERQVPVIALWTANVIFILRAATAVSTVATIIAVISVKEEKKGSLRNLLGVMPCLEDEESVVSRKRPVQGKPNITSMADKDAHLFVKDGHGREHHFSCLPSTSCLIGPALAHLPSPLHGSCHTQEPTCTGLPPASFHHQGQQGQGSKESFSIN